MSHQDIINAWKSDPEDRNANIPASPVGEELSDDELSMIQGGDSNCSACGSNCGRAIDSISLVAQPYERLISVQTFSKYQMFSK